MVRDDPNGWHDRLLRDFHHAGFHPLFERHGLQGAAGGCDLCGHAQEEQPEQSFKSRPFVPLKHEGRNLDGNGGGDPFTSQEVDDTGLAVIRRGEHIPNTAEVIRVAKPYSLVMAVRLHRLPLCFSALAELSSNVI